MTDSNVIFDVQVFDFFSFYSEDSEDEAERVRRAVNREVSAIFITVL